MRVRTATRAGHDRPNEDLVVATEHGAVLLDGAGLPGITPDRAVVGFVASLAASLGGGSTPLRRLLATAISTAPAVPGAMAAVAVVRVVPPSVKVLLLGDCTALVVGDNGIEVVHDSRESDVRQKVLATHATASDQVSAFRARRNCPGGFWVASDDPAAAEHALVETYELGSMREVVLLSNGVVGLSPDQVLALLHDGGPGAVLDRSRVGDDATVAWLTLRPAAEPPVG